ncbi:transmembrane protein 268 isoform X3 [Gymnodraco acuticeps]|uniref:Transmembrane protein 268 isoform X3 n=1 Tax=Gymnodraco acuticeps TaxID=8218 RepID=A0A6P8UJB5_GYMAC|nr:transmembrane protein 268 isoform X3 [Gymnodraco acuticeps]
MMESKNNVCSVMKDGEMDVQVRETKAQSEQSNNNRTNWSNGQCVVAMPSCSMLNPSFDLSLCRAKLENDGFQIPEEDMEAPLKTALEVPSVRRYMVFNSALFHFLMAPIDMNLDVRLIQVNERLVKHKLMVAVVDWVQSCSGNMQLSFVYWDMSRCLRALTETLEERSFVVNDTQNKLKKKMSHLALVTEETAVDLKVGGSDVEQDPDEQRPLLSQESTGSSTPSSPPEAAKVTTNYSLIPDQSLPAQAKAYQLLMTYSAAYVKLLVSQRLSGPTHHRLRPRRNHCTTAPLCLCQYIKKQILR